MMFRLTTLLALSALAAAAPARWQGSWRENAQDESTDSSTDSSDAAPAAQDSGSAAPEGSVSGQLTYYGAEITACGVYANHQDPGFWSANGGNDALCGKTIEVNRDGKTVRAIVQDICADCPYENIDLQVGAFQQLGTTTEGRFPVTWHFVDGGAPESYPVDESQPNWSAH